MSCQLDRNAEKFYEIVILNLTVVFRNQHLRIQSFHRIGLLPAAEHFRSVTHQIDKGEIMKVLVADDSGIMRKIIIRSLNSVGVTDVIEAANGQEAIDKFKESPVDLILTDWNMPEKSGLDVVVEIRATGSQVPIIMVTTESQKGHVIAAIQAGVNDYLTKPFEADDLRAKLDKFVSV